MHNDTEFTVRFGADPKGCDAIYANGLTCILSELRGSIDAAVSSALNEHRVLVSSILARRLMEPLDQPPLPPVTLQSVIPTTVTAPIPTAASTPRRTGRTTRELVLDVIATARQPISFADVVTAVAAAGGSEASAHKMRTDLLKRGAIVNRRSLYAITEVGQEMRAAYG